MSQNIFRGATKYIITAKAIGVIAFFIFFFLKRGAFSDYIRNSHSTIEAIMSELNSIINSNSDLQENQRFWQAYQNSRQRLIELSEDIEDVDLKKLSRNSALFLCVQCDELIAEIIGLDAVRLSSIGYFVETLYQESLYADSHIPELVMSVFPLKYSEKANFNRANTRGLLLLLSDAYSLSVREAQAQPSKPLTQ